MVSLVIHLFPPTIHPMVVHFTIAIIYLAGLAGVVGLFRRKDDFLVKSFLALLVLGVLATIAAGVAGVVSEYYAHMVSGVAPILGQHKKDGEITGVFVLAALVLQVLAFMKSKSISIPAVILCLIGVVFVSLAGHLGGVMVYGHGFGTK